MLDCLQASEIKAAVAEKNNVDIDIIVHQSIGSTNSWSLQQCKSGREMPFACFAEEQTQGRGRRGKQWLMSVRTNIAMSISWPFMLPRVPLNLLPLSVAMAIVETLENLGLKQVQIKWPNDVFVQGKKIAGILIETQPVANHETAVVIGVGLNFEMPEQGVKTVEDGVEVCSEITDVCREMKRQGAASDVNRTMVAVKLLQNVVSVVQGYELDSGRHLEKFRARYDYCKEKNVEVVLDDKAVMSGVACGVTDDAELLVMIDGEERSFNSADVSVKPGQS